MLDDMANIILSLGHKHISNVLGLNLCYQILKDQLIFFLLKINIDNNLSVLVCVFQTIKSIKKSYSLQLVLFHFLKFFYPIIGLSFFLVCSPDLL